MQFVHFRFILVPEWGFPFQALRNIIKKKWNKKVKPFPSIKNIYFSIGFGFFLKHSNYFVFIIKLKKNQNFNIDFQPKVIIF